MEMTLETFASEFVKEAEENKSKRRRTYSAEFTAKGGDGTVCAFSLSEGQDAIDYRIHYPNGHTETGVSYDNTGGGLSSHVRTLIRFMTGMDGAAENGSDPVLVIKDQDTPDNAPARAVEEDGFGHRITAKKEIYGRTVEIRELQGGGHVLNVGLTAFGPDDGFTPFVTNIAKAAVIAEELEKEASRLRGCFGYGGADAACRIAMMKRLAYLLTREPGSFTNTELDILFDAVHKDGDTGAESFADVLWDNAEKYFGPIDRTLLKMLHDYADDVIGAE